VDRQHETADKTGETKNLKNEKWIWTKPDKLEDYPPDELVLGWLKVKIDWSISKQMLLITKQFYLNPKQVPHFKQLLPMPK
jgi:hypothetical protein